MSDCFNPIKNESYLFTKDRLFWVYCLVSLFFTILGVVYLSQSNGSYLIFPWVISNMCLLYCIYILSIAYMPSISCFDLQNREDITCSIKSSWKWIIVNLIYLAILIIGLLWCTDYSNPQAGIFRSISVILVIIGGLSLLAFGRNVEKSYNYYSPFFWTMTFFLLIWLILSYCTLLITS